MEKNEIFDLVSLNQSLELEKMLENGLDSNLTNDTGRTLLSLAAACEYKKIAEVLLKYKADINKANTDELAYTPLIEAVRGARSTKLDMVQFLLQNKADIEKGDSRNGTPLLHACLGKKKEILEFLLQQGANPNMIDLTGKTPLHHLCLYAKKWAEGTTFYEIINGVKVPKANTIYQEYLAVFNMLLNQDTITKSIPTFDKSGYTPLMHAAETGSDEMLEGLFAKGADANSTNPKNYSALHAACDRGNLSSANILLKNGANINAMDSYGFTPLLGACDAGKVEIVKYLLDHGANTQLRVREGYGDVTTGMKALDIAKLREKNDLVELLSSTEYA